MGECSLCSRKSPLQEIETQHARQPRDREAPLGVNA
jgi:hypothetical protein